MSTHTFAGIAAVLLVSVLPCGGCTSRANPGPIHWCTVVDWVRYEDVCTCDPQPLPTREGERAELERGTMVGLFAPPGSLPPGAPVVIAHGGETTDWFVGSDGSLGVYVLNGGGYDLRGKQVAVRVGGASYTVALGTIDEVALYPAGVDPRFSSGDIAIEDPDGTIAVSARVVGRLRPTEIEHFAISTQLPFVGGWMPPPAIGDIVTWTGPGTEGTPIGFVALHASGVASGCYAGGVGGSGRCGCSVPRREAGMCRHEIMASRPDAGVDGGGLDAGVIEAGMIEAGVIEAGALDDAGPPGDAGAPF